MQVGSRRVAAPQAVLAWCSIVPSCSLLLLLGGLSCSKAPPRDRTPAEIAAKAAQTIYPLVVQLEGREKEADAKSWPKELLAEGCGRALEQLWDLINASTNNIAKFCSENRQMDPAVGH
jgi:hypothetical protein